nr:MAG TPA: hypothetical protein [Caudoviricetes sp.]
MSNSHADTTTPRNGAAINHSDQYDCHCRA